MTNRVYQSHGVRDIDAQIERLEHVRSCIQEYLRELDQYYARFLPGGAFPEQPFDKVMYLSYGGPEEARVFSAHPLHPLQYAELLATDQNRTVDVNNLATIMRNSGHTRLAPEYLSRIFQKALDESPDW